MAVSHTARLSPTREQRPRWEYINTGSQEGVCLWRLREVSVRKRSFDSLIHCSVIRYPGHLATQKVVLRKQSVRRKHMTLPACQGVGVLAAAGWSFYS